MDKKPETIEYLKRSVPVIFGHRGYKKNYPENTMISFQKALKAGAPLIELDVMLSKDREVVVIHDETLDRTTDGKGQVKDFTLNELKKLNAGSWFDEKFHDEKIPLLEEVFSELGERVLINVEIKPECYEEISDSQSIEKKVIDLVHRYGLTKRVIISSFNYKIIQRASKLDRTIKKAFILDTVPENFEEILNSGIFSVHSSMELATKDFVADIKNKGIMVFVWTINNPDDFKTLVDNGVDGIFTDDPGYFLKE